MKQEADTTGSKLISAGKTTTATEKENAMTPPQAADVKAVAGP
jgi:hypothetical protein